MYLFILLCFTYPPISSVFKHYDRINLTINKNKKNINIMTPSTKVTTMTNNIKLTYVIIIK